MINQPQSNGGSKPPPYRVEHCLYSTLLTSRPSGLLSLLPRKRWTIEFESLLFNFTLSKKKKHKDNSLCFFWRGRRDSTGQALSCLLRKLSHFLSLLLRKRWTVEFESLLFNFTLPKKKKHKDNSLCFFWRGRRDSNSRAGFPTYALSRGASSPT